MTILLLLSVILVSFILLVAIIKGWHVRRRYIAYISYVLRHKYHVFIAGRKLGVPIMQLLIHDWDKFLPSMMLAYATTFRTPEGDKRFTKNEKFQSAVNSHVNRNKHHWQYWLSIEPGRDPEPLKMPEIYVREMVADWIGAGIAITGEDNVLLWWNDNATNIWLHPDTRELVEVLIYLYATKRKSLDALKEAGLL